MRKVCLLSLLISAVLAGCSRPSFDPAAEQATLLKRDAEWAGAASAGQDVEKIISYWAPARGEAPSRPRSGSRPSCAGSPPARRWAEP